MASVLGHVPCSGRSGHEHALIVDTHHLHQIIGGVFRGRGDLLDPSCRHQTVEPLVFVGDLRDDAVQVFCIGHVGTDIVQAASPFWLDTRESFVVLS